MSEPTTQSVIVPVVDLERIAQALDNLCGEKTDDLSSRLRDVVRAAAPAPSSLAGGEVTEAAKRLGSDLDEGRIKDLAVSRDVAIVLAALSPEAPAREGWVADAAADMKVSTDDVVDALARQGYAPSEAALTPRHEAPAEGEGEAMTEREVRQWIDACNHEPARQVLRDYLALRARSSAPEAREGEAVWIDGHPTGFRAEKWFIALTTYGDRVVLKALPENYSYDFKTADETYIKADRIKQWMPFPDSEFTHPSAPSADKLRIAVEALGSFARAAEKLDGLWSEDDWRRNDSVRSGVTVRDIRRAHEALAALKADQGAK